MKLLIDNGIVSASQFLEADTLEQQLTWGENALSANISGFRRTELDRDADQQREKDALFTIGRLVRDGRIVIHTYSELTIENWRRGRGGETLVNALSQCKFRRCPAAIERSKFRLTINMEEWLAKGGKGNIKKGLPSSDFNQIPYFEWLTSLSPQQVSFLITNAEVFGLSHFEVASLEDLPWFNTLSCALGGLENLPDCFHIWTARRNGLDVFLTLEKKLPRAIEQLEGRRKKVIDLNVAVLRPTDLLRFLGITEVDDVPVQSGQFYSYAEILEIDRRLLER